MFPLIILNALGGLISGIWLAVLGMWDIIWFGIISLFISHFIIAFALMPAMLFLAPAAYFLTKKNLFATAIGWLLMSLSLFYTFGLITIWCVGILYNFTKMATPASIIPLLIWSYGVALGPWMFLAAKEQQSGDGEGSIFPVFFAEISYIVSILMILFLEITLRDVLIVFAIIMGVAMVIQLVIAYLSRPSSG